VDGLDDTGCDHDADLFVVLTCDEGDDDWCG